MADDWEKVVVDQLARLQNPHRLKKRATIVAIVDARLSGRSEETVWTKPDTCSRNIWHSKWKHDPVVADVLEQVSRLAGEHQDTRAVRALRQAAERMALASPIAAAKVIEQLAAADPAIVLRAAFGILDRGGLETANKASATTTIKLTWGETEADEQL